MPKVVKVEYVRLAEFIATCSNTLKVTNVQQNGSKNFLSAGLGCTVCVVPSNTSGTGTGTSP